MKIELWRGRGEAVLSLSTSPSPLYGEYGCLRFIDKRKLTNDWCYMPIESRDELVLYKTHMEERPGEYSTISFLPSPQRM